MSLSWTRIADWIGLGTPAVDADPITADRLVAARGRQTIGYSPQLISRLHGDHGSLIELFQGLEGLVQTQRLAELPAALASFKSKFDVHVLNENLRFYCYLEQRLEQRPADLALIRQFRREMDAIAREVVDFARRYQDSGVDAGTQQAFANDLRQMGRRLAQRIQREEADLYPLYEACGR